MKKLLIIMSCLTVLCSGVFAGSSFDVPERTSWDIDWSNIRVDCMSENVCYYAEGKQGELGISCVPMKRRAIKRYCSSFKSPF